MGTSVPISIHGWMKSACTLRSKNAYVESAVTLAWALTKHICLTMAASPEVKLQDHIAAENIILFVERPPFGINDAIDHAEHAVTDVKFQFEISSVASPLGNSSTNNNDNTENATHSHCQVSICAALGKLLFEIFSMGRSNSLDIISHGTSNINLSDISGNSDFTQNNNAIFPPPKKRHATMPTNNSSISSAAKNLFLELGMPLALCRLVCDLLSAENNGPKLRNDLLDADDGPSPNVALTSVKEAFWDLTKMKNRPKAFLFDRTCPRNALDGTCLFDSSDKQLFGRVDEKRSLMTSKNKISEYMNNPALIQGASVRCETAFLSGYAGSGKSSLLNTLIHACNEDQWFVLGCKFEKLVAPHMILAKAFDEFFGKWGSANGSMKNSFFEICRRIFAALDDEGFRQLCRLVPNFAGTFPLLSMSTNDQSKDGGISSMDKVGSAKKRLRSLFSVLVKSICSGGHPVLITLDDLQWSESFVMDFIAEFAVNFVDDASGVTGESCRRGLLMAGTYRNNEVQENSDLIRSIKFMKESRKANVSTLNVGELTKSDIIQLISEKLCLPWRYTKELAGVVRNKTRGNPFFVIQFLRSIIRSNMLSFSVKSRRWVWDCDVVDMQMISDGVAELLASTFSQLSSKLMQAVKVVSCLGSQVEEATIDAINSRNEILPFRMQDQLQLAVTEGIMEKAGPVYQFTHDIIQQTVYELIPLDNRETLHKEIGMAIFKSAANDSATHLLAVDQINTFCKVGNPSPEERAQFVKSNVAAARFAMAASSFVQARSYIDVGMQLLDDQHWETQYLLSLDLFEMSASVSCINGDISKMSICLDEILSHARTFNDSLKASSLLVKLLASSSKFEEARNNCEMILSKLGEVFPSEVGLPVVLKELSGIQTRLRGITRDQIKSLPMMTNMDKLNVMKFLNMLCMYCNFSKPLLLPLLSCRMVALTMEYGFCADSIVGFATVGYSTYLFTEDIQLASNIGKVCESLVEESPMKHILRSRLCNELYGALKCSRQPWRSVISLYPDLYNSAMMAGDTENASICRWSYCAGGFWTGSLGLGSVSKNIAMCIKEVAKYQQNTILYCIMGVVHPCRHLSGRNTVEVVDVKSFDELDEIGEKTCNAFLVWQTFMCRMSGHFWMREYMAVAELSEKYSEKHPSSQQKRILHVFRSFYEGIAYLNLARDTKEPKWRIHGEKAVVAMKQLEVMMLKCNFENKCKLLEAELHYLDGDLESAEAAYKASIEAAHKNLFIHEEALAYEHYGIFCVENHRVNRGSEILQLALGKYRQWGAVNKASELQRFIDLFDPGYRIELKLM